MFLLVDVLVEVPVRVLLSLSRRTLGGREVCARGAPLPFLTNQVLMLQTLLCPAQTGQHRIEWAAVARTLSKSVDGPTRLSHTLR